MTVSNNSVYINTSGCGNGILSVIANDIFKELTINGIRCFKGSSSEYSNQEIAYHMWWRGAKPYSTARINSVFVTHIDDKLKENDLVLIKDKFDSYITMSEEDAVFLIGLGFDPKKVYGVKLPVRNSYVRPLSLGIFSNCYSDNRKNEQWLLDFCINNRDAKLLNYVFIGDGWSQFVGKLHELGCSFEWHCVSRDMPFEYFFQQIKLSSIDYYIYMGMDGGAMGTYDAYAQCVDLCVSDDGYHKEIPNIRYKFNSREEFYERIGIIAKEQRDRVDFFTSNSVSNYVSSLFSIWSNSLSNINDGSFIDCSKFGNVVAKRRKNYFPISFQRIRQTLSNYLFVARERRK